jgi:hypothetical protein
MILDAGCQIPDTDLKLNNRIEGRNRTISKLFYDEL